MGLQSSRDRALIQERLPDEERYYGLESFGNTCYCNSVLQALYHCPPFRSEMLLEYREVRRATARGHGFMF